MFMAWVADQQLQSVKRRTLEGLDGPCMRAQGPGTSPEVHPGAGGGNAAGAGRGRQPSEDRRRLRVLPQHLPEGAAAGGNTSVTRPFRCLNGAALDESWDGIDGRFWKKEDHRWYMERRWKDSQLERQCTWWKPWGPR